MSDLISRNALLADIEATIENSGCVNHEGEILDCIAYADTIDAVPVARGEWIHTITAGDGKLLFEDVKCSECDFKLRFYHDLPYCPNCGAKMSTE